MIRLKKCERHFPLSNGLSARAKSFVFFDKNTGARRFEIKADRNGRMPIDEAVSFLAVHCAAHHQVPNDFEVLVEIRKDLINDLVSRARTLIDSCSVSPPSGLPKQLTRRQTEVLMGITQTLTNKEIASRLNVSERTVKFHVSTLLEKFHVSRRVDLLVEVEGRLLGTTHKRESQPRDAFKDEDAIAPAIIGIGVAATRHVSMERGSSS